MKSKLFAVGLVLTLFAGLGVAVAQSSGWNFGRFQTFMKGLGVGTRLQTGMVTAQAQGSREIFTGYNSSGSKTFAVSGAGAVTAVGLTNTGATTCNGALLPAKVTADACTDAGYGPGAMFWNATSNYMCYCDGNTDDIKMNDNTTACF